MAKKIEILNGRPSLLLEKTDIDLYYAYKFACDTYAVLEDRAQEAMDASRAGIVNKALADIAFTNVAATGVISNTTQTQLAHVFYDCARTLFTDEVASCVHGEIVAVGLFLQLHFNGLDCEEERLRELLKAWGMPDTLAKLGIDATKENLEAIEEYIVSSRHYNSTDPADRALLRESISRMA